jgi:hypothetical protein
MRIPVGVSEALAYCCWLFPRRLPNSCCRLPCPRMRDAHIVDPREVLLGCALGNELLQEHNVSGPAGGNAFWPRRAMSRHPAGNAPMRPASACAKCDHVMQVMVGRHKIAAAAGPACVHSSCNQMSSVLEGGGCTRAPSACRCLCKCPTRLYPRFIPLARPRRRPRRRHRVPAGATPAGMR